MPGDFFLNNEMRLANLQLCLDSGAPPAIGATDTTPCFKQRILSHHSSSVKTGKKRLLMNCCYPADWVGFIVTLHVACNCNRQNYFHLKD